MDIVAPSSPPILRAKSRAPHRQRAREGNHKHKKQEWFRSRIGALKLEDRRRQRESILYPNGFPTMDIMLEKPLGLPDASTTKQTILIPFSTTGIGFAVQALYLRYFDHFSRTWRFNFNNIIDRFIKEVLIAAPQIEWKYVSTSTTKYWLWLTFPCV